MKELAGSKGNVSKQGRYQDKGLPAVGKPGLKCGSSGFDGMPSGQGMPKGGGKKGKM